MVFLAVLILIRYPGLRSMEMLDLRRARPLFPLVCILTMDLVLLMLPLARIKAVLWQTSMAKLVHSLLHPERLTSRLIQLMEQSGFTLRGCTVRQVRPLLARPALPFLVRELTFLESLAL